jgi:formylglycine-generating enzyme required for sulfatase activity
MGVSFRDLSDYVTDEVQARTLRQGHPQVPFEGTGQSDASGDFPVARLVAGLGSPAPAPAAIIDHGPQPGQVKVNPKDGQRYVWIPAGSFIMGCSPGDTDCQPVEKPAHNVSIRKGF